MTDGMGLGIWSSSSEFFLSRILLCCRKLDLFSLPLVGWFMFMQRMVLESFKLCSLCQYFNFLSVFQTLQACDRLHSRYGCAPHSTSHHSHGLVLHSG